LPTTAAAFPLRCSTSPLRSQPPDSGPGEQPSRGRRGQARSAAVPQERGSGLSTATQKSSDGHETLGRRLTASTAQTARWARSSRQIRALATPTAIHVQFSRSGHHRANAEARSIVLGARVAAIMHSSLSSSASCADAPEQVDLCADVVRIGLLTARPDDCRIFARTSHSARTKEGTAQTYESERAAPTTTVHGERARQPARPSCTSPSEGLTPRS
jgi:hypothetical protein